MGSNMETKIFYPYKIWVKGKNIVRGSQFSYDKFEKPIKAETRRNTVLVRCPRQNN